MFFTKLLFVYFYIPNHPIVTYLNILQVAPLITKIMLTRAKSYAYKSDVPIYCLCKIFILRFNSVHI